MFNVDCRKQVFDLVETYHYSRLVPAFIRYVHGWEEQGRVVAGIIWTIPASRWKEPTIELARLVRTEDTKPPLSKLISESCKVLKRSGEDLCLSFADSTHSHHGGIYQACSWNYHGDRKGRVDAFMIDGVRVPARTCNHRYGTSGLGLVDILASKGVECSPCRSLDKSLYWRALSSSGVAKADLLGLKSVPYRKPDYAA